MWTFWSAVDICGLLLNCPLLPLFVSEVGAPGFVVFNVPIMLIVDDLPAPVPVRIDSNQSPAILLMGPAFAVLAHQFLNRMRDYFLWYVRAPGDRIQGHIDHAIPVCQYEEIHENMPHHVIRRYTGIKDLREDFGKHIHTIRSLSWTV